MFKKILVATHGTEGAKKAETCGIELSKTFCTELYGLYVIPSSWAEIAGIEWLHSSKVRMEFYKHMETELNRRAKEVIDEFTRKALNYQITVIPLVKVGKPELIIIDESKKNNIDLLILGRRIKSKSEEYKYTISFKKLEKTLTCPILLI